MVDKEVKIRKVENGYVIKTSVVKESKTKHIEAMMNLLRAAGVYEGWQEHKEEEIRRSLEKMILMPSLQREEKEIICNSMSEVVKFIKNFFEEESSPPIEL